MRMLIRNISLLVATMADIYTELKKIRELLSSNTQNDMAITAKQAAAILRVSESTINKMYRNGKLHKSVIGGKRGFSHNEVRGL